MSLGDSWRERDSRPDPPVKFGNGQSHQGTGT